MKAKPFLKWAGGKRQLQETLKEKMPAEYNRYFEPMVGGGALFFYVEPESALIADLNKEIIDLYRIVKNNPEELIRIVNDYLAVNSKSFYNNIRALDRNGGMEELSDLEKAARTLYLNRTSFNGLYRVNKSGQFNAPYGKYTNPSIDTDNIRACSEALQNTQIEHFSYSSILDVVNEGDFVYLDPPYIPLSETSSFTAYSSNGFSIGQHKELSDFCKELNRRNVKFMLSNSDTELSNSLYSDFNVIKVLAKRLIAAKSNSRRTVSEIIVRNYE